MTWRPVTLARREVCDFCWREILRGQRAYQFGQARIYECVTCRPEGVRSEAARSAKDKLA